MLSWLFTGNLYDNGRWPVVTILLAVGLGVSIARWRSFAAGRALVVIWVVTLLMTFGRTTFGSLYAIVPGSSDIFIRRFEMAVQLSGILLAAVGTVFLGQLVLRAVTSLFPPDRRDWATQPGGRGIVAGLSIVGLFVVLAPVWSTMDTYDGHNATNIAFQADADATQAPQLDRLLDYVQAHPRGRVYAGSPTNWGQYFTVGYVPVFKYLEGKDIDEVGYTLRTASLMTDPEYSFDERNPGDYPLFGIGYIITPSSMASPVPAEKVRCSGNYCLWALPTPGYIHVYDTTGTLTATRADVGTQSTPLLHSPLLNKQRDLTVAFNGDPAATPTAPDQAALRGSPGHVVAEHADLKNGTARAVVRTNRRSTVVLERVVRPRVARHGERSARPDGHGGAGPRGRRRRPGPPRRDVLLRRLRIVRGAARAGAGRARRPRRGTPAVATGTGAPRKHHLKRPGAGKRPGAESARRRCSPPRSTTPAGARATADSPRLSLPSVAWRHRDPGRRHAWPAVGAGRPRAGRA